MNPPAPKPLSPILPGATIGVLGSGQLGRMFAIAARELGYRIHVFSPENDSPAGQIGDVEYSCRYDDLEKLRRGPEAERVHYLSICSPNYLHDAHIRLALRTHAHAICEKPLVIKEISLPTGASLRSNDQMQAQRVHQLFDVLAGYSRAEIEGAIWLTMVGGSRSTPPPINTTS